MAKLEPECFTETMNPVVDCLIDLYKVMHEPEILSCYCHKSTCGQGCPSVNCIRLHILYDLRCILRFDIIVCMAALLVNKQPHLYQKFCQQKYYHTWILRVYTVMRRQSSQLSLLVSSICLIYYILLLF